MHWARMTETRQLSGRSERRLLRGLPDPNLPARLSMPKLNGWDMFELSMRDIQDHYSKHHFSAAEYVAYCIEYIRVGQSISPRRHRDQPGSRGHRLAAREPRARFAARSTASRRWSRTTSPPGTRRLARVREQMRGEGIDAALSSGGGERGLDALLLCDCKGLGQHYAAQAGYPVVCIPVGLDADGFSRWDCRCSARRGGRRGWSGGWAGAIEDPVEPRGWVEAHPRLGLRTWGPENIPIEKVGTKGGGELPLSTGPRRCLRRQRGWGCRICRCRVGNGKSVPNYYARSRPWR
ncbi:hypothetical protein QBC33DRAFT_209729 [Phialemonium atrogriseum]|uniref:Uncharacterized protein n=1 Tax=Phialemonium atrogriseum TaxID=1093897 RepID=A0AAJ0BTF4_9PEZI|nr:uncharacterized protein QBC33DRAFT_209729 [Phialemonium atrogriseum]KAK1764169.1 hypothetical protein QBC33DRAFT_209729 [Phialemonium atrogriseum]